MSGPIIRKYGFPNFEKIFGARAPQHGIDETAAAAPRPPGAETSAEPAAAPEPAAPAEDQTAARSREKK